MAHTLKEAVKVSIVIDGEAVEVDYAAGDTDLPPVIADLLVSQGLATQAKSKASKSTTTDAPTEA